MSLRKLARALIAFSLNCRHICGGAIIAPRYALTAASCYYLPGDAAGTAAEYTVAAGSPEATDDVHKQVRKVERFVVYPGYDSMRHLGDLAALVLDKAFSFNQFVGAIAFPRYGHHIEDKSTAVVSGWGAEVANSSQSTKNLNYAEVFIVSNEVCDSAYDGVIYESNVCAAAPNKGFCTKDHGGPLVQNKLLVGIVSWSIGCATEEFPGVYTRVDRFYDWINNTRPNDV